MIKLCSCEGFQNMRLAVAPSWCEIGIQNPLQHFEIRGSSSFYELQNKEHRSQLQGILGKKHETGNIRIV